MNPNEDEKLMAVLEDCFSLHEADELYNAIFDPEINKADIEEMLEGFHESEHPYDED